MRILYNEDIYYISQNKKINKITINDFFEILWYNAKRESEKMTTKFVTDYIDKKLDENPNYIRYTFYELQVKNNLSEEEADEFLRIKKTKVIMYIFTNVRFTYQNADMMVQPNELIIAIKDE